MRCIHLGRRGQCTLPKVDNSDYCSKHSNEKDRMTRYRIQDSSLRERMTRHAEGGVLATVVDEVILLRSLIEERLELAQSKAEKEAAFSVVTPMVAQVNKLVENLAKMRKSNSEVLDKDSISRLGDAIVTILIDELNDIHDRDTIIDKVAERIASTIVEAQNA